MKTIEILPAIISRKDFKHRKFIEAMEGDCQRYIDYDCLITTNGRNKIFYKKLDIDTSELRWAVKNITYGTGNRTTGLLSTSRIFGFMPRRTLMGDYCRDSSISREHTQAAAILKDFSRHIEQYYREFFPEELQAHYETVQERILPEWRIEGSPFTSGIVNKDNRLKYHRDAGNFRGCLSNMVAMRRGVDGGHLCIPEYDVKLEICDNSLLIFDGQQIMHGVTALHKRYPAAYRYTVVWYALEQLWKCEPLTKEIKRIRTVKRIREFKRLALKSEAVQHES